jgi:RNA polymerase sigma factor (sigma-70 family)
MNSAIDPDQLITSAYAAHAGNLLRRLTAMTRDAAAAEDLTQESFARLIQTVRAGRAPDDTGAWLNRVGENLARSRGRRLTVADRRRHSFSLPAEEPSAETLALEAERYGELHAAMAAIGPIDRRALVLSARGYRGAEIARSLGRTDGATRTLLCRARTKVRRLMVEAGAW